MIPRPQTPQHNTNTLPDVDALEPVESRWQAYPEYKDSGVEWLGEIPTHWESLRLRHAASIEMGQSPESTDYNLNGVGRPFLQGNAEFGERYPTPRQFCPTAKKIVQRGDFLISVRAPVGALNIADQSYGIGRGLCGIRVNPRYLVSEFTWFLLQVVRQELHISATGSTYDAVSIDEVASLRIFLPSAEEQCAIAAFLDRETALIDHLIATKERLIALLQEKRAALISHAVTKGLDPNVPMKDSGIEWLGEIPAHWEVKSLKYLTTSIEQGWSPSCENHPAEPGEWGVLKVGCVNGIYFDPTENKALPIETKPRARYEIHPGDLLISRANTKELLGSAAVVSDTVPQRLLLCDKLYRLRLDPKLCLPEFISFALGSSVSRYQMEREATGASSSMQNIGQDTIKNLHLPIPKVREQEAIVSFIHAQNVRFEALSSQIQQAIELLSEFRAALITAAVTGKIEVSNLEAVERSDESWEVNVDFKRAVLAAGIVDQLHQERTFGRVKLEKVLFLTEKICGIDTQSKYRRAAAGPLDIDALDSIENQLQERRWFEKRKREGSQKGYYYVPLENAEAYKEYFDLTYREVADQFYQIVGILRRLRTENCEIVATLYSAWQDLLMEHGLTTDTQIVQEVLYNWHESKQQISEDRWYAALKWMRETGLTPASD